MCVRACAAGTGHASALSCVRFLAGDAAAVSSGSADRAVMLWAVEDVRPGGGGGGALLGAGAAAIPNMPRRVCMLREPQKQFD